MKQGIRTIKTLQFGEINVELKHIFNFPNGLLGFEDLQDFVLISEEETIPFKWLLSVEKLEIGFPLLSPWHVDITYDPGDIFDINSQVIFVVVTLEDDNGSMTANMKAPLILDVAGQTGQQAILPSERYSPNYIIVKKQAD